MRGGEGDKGGRGRKEREEGGTERKEGGRGRREREEGGREREPYPSFSVGRFLRSVCSSFIGRSR